MYLIENNLSCKNTINYIEKNYSLNITSKNSKNSKNSIFTVFTIIETKIKQVSIFVIQQ